MDAPAVMAAVDAAGGRAAAIIVCNPGNPQGEILSAHVLRDLAKIAVASGAVLIVDECYTDLTFGLPAPGYLAVAEEAGGAGPYVVLHSLSKRSGAPGLRSGFMAGDPDTVAAYAQYNRNCGVSTALPVNAAAAALWADDAHVARGRALLAGNWDLADCILGDVPQYRLRPPLSSGCPSPPTRPPRACCGSSTGCASCLADISAPRPRTARIREPDTCASRSCTRKA